MVEHALVAKEFRDKGDVHAQNLPHASKQFGESASAGRPIVGCGNEQLLSQSGDGFSRRWWQTLHRA